MTACVCCGSTDGVQLEAARTAYHREAATRYERLMFEDPVNDIPADPNAPIMLCRDCAAEHHENWDMVWSDFYASLM